MVKTCQNKVHESSHHFLQDSPIHVHRPTRQPPSIVLSGGGFSNDLEAECTLVSQTQSGSKWHMRVSINGGTPKWIKMVGLYGKIRLKTKMDDLDWFGGTTILGNLHMGLYGGSLVMGHPQVTMGCNTKSWSSMTTGWFGGTPMT